MQERVFLRSWQLPELRERAERESHMLNLDDSSIVWEKQAKLFEAFERVGYAKGEQKLNWDLPGHGKAKADCGELFTIGCDRVQAHENGRVYGRVAKRSCRQKGCPTCYESWAAAQASRSIVRLASYVVGVNQVQSLISKLRSICAVHPRAVFYKTVNSVLEDEIKAHSHDRGRRLRPIHVVLSPPKHAIDESIRGFRKGRRLAYRIAREEGLIGGAVIFHPYQLHCPRCYCPIPDYGKTCPKCGGSSFVWVWSPHFHVVGFGWIHGVAEGFLKHGWVVKNLGVRESVFATFLYLLSHSGVSAVHTTTWFGALSYNKMRAIPVLNAPLELCPYCKHVLLPLKWVGGLDRPPPEVLEKGAVGHFLGDVSDWKCWRGGI
mgnify:FL=1